MEIVTTPQIEKYIIENNSTVNIIQEKDIAKEFIIQNNVSLIINIISIKSLRNVITIKLVGEHARANVNIIYLTKKNYYDMNIHVIHNAPNTLSRIETTGIIIDGKSLMCGTIEIQKNAENSDGYEKANTIIIGNGRSISIPNLNIYNNNVKCSHGSTVTRLDEEKLFYLQSRGISKEDATRMAISGFIFQAIQKIENITFREEISDLFNEEIEQLERL